FQHTQTRQLRHFQVQQNQVGGVLFDQLKRAQPIACCDRVISQRLQPVAEGGGNVRIVIDDQDLDLHGKPVRREALGVRRSAQSLTPSGKSSLVASTSPLTPHVHSSNTFITRPVRGFGKK